MDRGCEGREHQARVTGLVLSDSRCDRTTRKPAL